MDDFSKPLRRFEIAHILVWMFKTLLSIVVGGALAVTGVSARGEVLPTWLYVSLDGLAVLGVALSLVIPRFLRDPKQAFAGQRRRMISTAVPIASAMVVLTAAIWYQHNSVKEASRRAESHRLATQALQTTETSGAKALKLAVQAARTAPTREADDALASILSMPPRRLTLKHGGAVKCVTFSPDGRRLLTCTDDGKAGLWEIMGSDGLASAGGPDTSHKAQQTALAKKVCFLRHTALISTANFSTDGNRIVTASADKVATVWESKTGEHVMDLKGHTDSLLSAAFSSDGRTVVTASADRTAIIWDVRTGRPIRTLRHEGSVWDARFSKDGRRIVTAGDFGVAIWDTASLHKSPILHSNAPSRGVEFSPDGVHVVTVGQDASARLWDSESGRLLFTLTPEDAKTVNTSASFSPDGGRIITTGTDDAARIWDSKTGRPLRVLSGHEGTVRHASFSPDGLRIVTASDDNTAIIWNAALGLQLARLTGHTDAVYAAVFSPDGQSIATASLDHSAGVWSTTSGALLGILSKHTAAVNSIAYSHDGRRLVSASADGTACIWNATTMKCEHPLQGHKGAVNSAAFSPDDRLVVTVLGPARNSAISAGVGRRQRRRLGCEDPLARTR